MKPPAMVEVKCDACRQPFQARVADRARGWAKCCSKSCAAKKRTNAGKMRVPAKRKWVPDDLGPYRLYDGRLPFTEEDMSF